MGILLNIKLFVWYVACVVMQFIWYRQKNYWNSNWSFMLHLTLLNIYYLTYNINYIRPFFEECKKHRYARNKKFSSTWVSSRILKTFFIVISKKKTFKRLLRTKPAPFEWINLETFYNIMDRFKGDLYICILYT